MGLFDFFKKKKGKNSDNSRNESTPERIRRGSIITKKIEVTEKNIDEICKDFIAFDVETTGLTPGVDVIIEVGAVKYYDGNIVGSYCTLVDEGISVPYAASRVNHISTEMLRSQGRKPEIVYKELFGFLSSALSLYGHTYICAHNASFDMTFLKETLERFGYSGVIQYIDTLSLSRELIKGIRKYTQDSVATYFDITNQEAHRAGSDAEVCGKILLELLKMKRDKVEKEKSQEKIQEERYEFNEAVNTEEIARKWAEQQKIWEERHRPNEEEKEIFAVIASILKKNGCDIHNLQAYKNRVDHVLMVDKYTILRYKIAKTKSYVIIPKSYAAGLEKIEDCPKQDGITNVRLLFNNPFELDEYGGLFRKIRDDIIKSQGAGIDPLETEYLATTAKMTAFTDAELESCVENAKERQRLKLEKEHEAQSKKEKAIAMKIEKAEKAREKQKQKEEKVIERIERIEKKKLIQEKLKILVNTEDFSEENILKISKQFEEVGKRAIVQLDDDGQVLMIYGSSTEASDVVGISPKTIRDVLNGKYKHGGGYCWKYADDLIAEKAE